MLHGRHLIVTMMALGAIAGGQAAEVLPPDPNLHVRRPVEDLELGRGGSGIPNSRTPTASLKEQRERAKAARKARKKNRR